MTRGLEPAQLAVAAGRHRVAVPLIEMFFDSGTLRITLGQWNITWNGNLYTSTVLVGFRQLRESANSIEGMEFNVDGVNPAIQDILAVEPYRGRIVRQLKAFIDPDTNALVGAPKTKFLGRIRELASTELNNQCSVVCTAEHYDAELDRAAPTRLNDSDQERFHPGDLGCQYVEQMVEKNIVWPSREAFQR